MTYTVALTVIVFIDLETLKYLELRGSLVAKSLQLYYSVKALLHLLICCEVHFTRLFDQKVESKMPVLVADIFLIHCVDGARHDS